MRWLGQFTAQPSFFYVVSHERSGTHFLINCIQLNTSVDLKYQSVGEWFGPYNRPRQQAKHIQKKFRSLHAKNHYILKSHCDRDLFSKFYVPGKVVYIFRDYRDVLTSYYHFLQDGYIDWFKTHNPALTQDWFTSFSDFIRQPLPDFLRFNYSLEGDFSTPLERWLNHVKQWIQYPSDDVKIITYNQLYLAPEATTQALLNFLDLPRNETFTPG